MRQEETVEVTVRLPEAVVDFIEKMEGNVEEYIARTIIDLMVSYMESMDARQLMDTWKLTPVFKEYGVLPSYYKEP